MLRKYKGINYFIEVEAEPFKNTYFFSMTAIHKKSRRTSCINTLNYILSQFGIEIDNVRSEESDWLLTRKELKPYIPIASSLFRSKTYLKSLDLELDEDRECSEWENTIGK